MQQGAGALCCAQRRPPAPPHTSALHLEVDDVGSDQDTDALQQVPDHVDEGGTDTGVGLGIRAVGTVFMAVVTVAMPGLVEGNTHPTEEMEVSGHRGSCLCLSPCLKLMETGPACHCSLQQRLA